MRGLVLKFIFGTALNTDLVQVSHRVDSLQERTGDLIDEAQRQITMSRELYGRIRANGKAMAQMILLLKQQNPAISRE
jgi:hypothetical protein